ncbi:MAG: hypothetical protein HOJ16_00085 [Candidatus Peribacter sp.]|jgi:hypothetical protein|nr:hypothetical protein [Candidatus Peribacter sp.]
MRALILMAILATIGCGELVEHNPDFEDQACLVTDTRYSHTRSFCIGDDGRECFESVHILCDFAGEQDRADCIQANELPELGNDCKMVNVCWTH